MKKYILFCLVSIWSLTTLAINVTSNLNPYAYNLKHSISGDYITFSYCLNANATSVDIVVLNGEKEVKRYPLTGDYLKKTESNDAVDPYQTKSAAHTYRVPAAQLQAGVKLTWRVEVKGAGRTQVEVYGTGGTAMTYSFQRPSSVDIIKDETDAGNYGKLLVVESVDAVRNTTGNHSSPMLGTNKQGSSFTDNQGAGLYVFNPDLSPRKNSTKTYVFNGGSDTRFQSTTFAPNRVRVSKNGRIFVSSMGTKVGTKKCNVLWEIDPANFKNWTAVIGEDAGATYDASTYHLTTSGGDFIAAPSAGLDVRGTGKDLKLLLLSVNKDGFENNDAGYMLCEYNLGEGTTWSAKPNTDFNVNENVFVANTNSNAQYDKDGGVWCISYRADCSKDAPALVYKDASGVEKYKNISRDYTINAGFRFNDKFDKVIIAGRDDGTEDEKKVGKVATVYNYSKDADGKPVLTQETVIDMSAAGKYINDFVWDNANNVYVVAHTDRQNNTNDGKYAGGNGRLALYCLPYSAEDVFTTSGPESFTITATVQDPSGEGVVTASKYEFRGLWCATVTNIDWPSNGAKGNIAKQKQELIDILDALQAGNINAVCLQVRSLSDALYQSSYEPWAAALTGTRGQDPGYDPLAFAIEETHKRGMELHAWVNPFRVTSEKSTTGSTPYQALPETDKLYNTALKGKIVEYSITNSEGNLQKGEILDPGYPEVREHIVKVLMEIVTKYDIDGLLMDDYFYPSVDANIKNTFDSGSQTLYFTPNQNTIEDFNENGSKLDDWRRGNVDKVIEALSNQMRAVKPWVRFGMGPFGIWSSGEKDVIYTKYGIEKPDGITGANYYGDRGCNTVEWIKNGWVDYVNPQLYWPSSTSPKDYRRGQDYHILYNWWSDVCTTLSTALPGNQQVQFYPSHAVDRVYNPTYNWGVDEMRTQVSHTRDVLTNGYSGSVYYSARYYLNLNNWINTKHGLTITSTMCQELRASHYQTKALVPPMSWKSNTQLAAPTQLRLDGNTLSWQHSAGAARYTVYVYPKNVNMYTAISEVRYLQQVVYGNSITLAGFDPATHNVAVRSYDRYGVEYEATEYAPEIIWVLNGGEVGTREVTETTKKDAPTLDELWKLFRNDASLTQLDESLSKLEVTDIAGTKGLQTADQLNNVFNGNWGWLKEYIMEVQNEEAKNGDTFTDGTASRTVATLEESISSGNNLTNWRYSVAAFFKNTRRVGWPNATADFRIVGQRDAWKDSYEDAHTNTTTTTQEIVLPNFWDEDEAFVLPVASEMSHSKGYTLAGWTDASGNPITKITKGYAGTIYAQWTNASNTLVKWYLNGGVYTGKTTLPLEIEHDYVLPSATQMHKEGQKFVGWYDNVNFTGDAKQTVEAGYAGSLYAKWLPAEHVTWHINTSVEMGNEDLWQQFMTEYNEYYYSGLPATQQRGRTSIDNLKTFISVSGSATDKRVADFMTDLNSPMRWLGNYITNAVKEYVISSGSPTEMDPNEALWQLFKEDAGIELDKALSELTMTDIAGKVTTDHLTVVFGKPEWTWLKTYIKAIQDGQINNKVVCDDGITRNVLALESDVTSETNDSHKRWKYSLAAFFKQSQYREKYPATADFSSAGAYSAWGADSGYKTSTTKAKVDELIESLDPDHIHIKLESDWSYLLDAFFNHKTADAKCGFPVDFTLVGLPKPNGDADAGWYNAWFTANCPQYMLDGDHVSQIARDGYLLGGWYYGDETGYIHTAAMRVDGTFSTDIEDKYQNHLWARWLKLHLYEGYVDADPYALDANGNRKQGKVNNNEELASCGYDGYKRGYKMDVDRKLVGGQYNTMVLPFAINGQGSYKDENLDGVWDNPDTGKPGKEYYLSRVLDAERNMLLDPATTSILVYDGCEILTENGEQIIEFIFHEYAQLDECEDLVAHKPFLIKPANDITTTMRFDWEASFASFENNGIPAMLDDDAEPVFQAALGPTTLLANHATESHLMLVTNNRLAQVNSDSEMLGLRGYFRVPKAGTQAINSRIRVVEEGTDVENHPTTGAVVVRKVLRNGHIYILRDGKTYSITGARVE